MEFGVQEAQARTMATEMLAETAWRQMFESLDGFGASGVQGQMQGDWLAQTMAGELAGHLAGTGGDGHGA